LQFFKTNEQVKRKRLWYW